METEFRNSNGKQIGKVVKRGVYYELQNPQGHTLAKYDPSMDRTLTKEGHLVGNGNQLSRFLTE